MHACFSGRGKRLGLFVFLVSACRCVDGSNRERIGSRASQPVMVVVAKR